MQIICIPSCQLVLWWLHTCLCNSQLLRKRLCRANISKSRRYPGKHLCRWHGHKGVEKGGAKGAKSPRIWDSLYCCTVITYFIWNVHTMIIAWLHLMHSTADISQLHVTFSPSLYTCLPAHPLLQTCLHPWATSDSIPQIGVPAVISMKLPHTWACLPPPLDMVWQAHLLSSISSSYWVYVALSSL